MVCRAKTAAAEQRILELEESVSQLQESEATATAAVAEHMAARAQQTERIKKAKAGGAKGKSAVPRWHDSMNTVSVRGK